VIAVEPGSSAERAGIKPAYRDRRGRVVVGDVIVAIDGEPIRTGGELGLALEKRRENDTVVVTLDREGREEDVQVTLGAPR
jgi:S1-C subfamily serine protease